MATRPHVIAIACACGLSLVVRSALGAEENTPPAQPSEQTVVVGAEVGTGQTKASPDTPTSSFFYQRATGRWSPSDSFDLAASFRATEDLARSPDTGSTYATSGDAVFFGALDATWDFVKNWNASLGVNGSPKATRDVAVANPLATAGQDPNALVRAKTSSVGAIAEAGYDSFDLDHVHDADIAVDVSAGLTGFFTEQETLAPADAAAQLGKAKASLTQTRLGGTTTLTLFENTDLGLDGAYYIYNDKNPGDVGTFVTGLQNAWGAGLPMLPPRWTLRPEAAERIGRVTLRAFYQYADLAVDGGTGHTVGGKIQIAIQNVKLFVTGSYRSDIFSEGTAATWSAGAGFSLRL
jgi:hypothetical protein